MSVLTTTPEFHGSGSYMLDAFEDELVNVEIDQAVPNHTTAQLHMGNVTLESVMSQLPKKTKLHHAELILRGDLRRRYLAMHKRIIKIAEIRLGAGDFVDEDEDMDAIVSSCAKEETVFHGTARHNIGSIVRYGFGVPTANEHEDQYLWGTKAMPWGLGIYTSPDPNLALYHSAPISLSQRPADEKQLWPGKKLIVCSIVMGRRRHLQPTYSDLDSCLTPGLDSNFDSHASSDNAEYVVFHPAQILPLYVLHVHDGPENPGDGLRMTKMPQNPVEYGYKHLPFGFGGLSGSDFVVEARAAVDEDDDQRNYYEHLAADPLGEFQDYRFH